MTLLCVLALSVLGAFSVFAAGGKADFSIAASPSSQTVSQGQSTAYSVTVTRVNGFTDSVTLTAGNLPTGASASWKLGNGTNSNVVPPTQNSATLTIQTASTTPNGTSQPVVTAAGSKLSHTATITLVVQPAAQSNFSLTASPVTQTVIQGDQVQYALNVNRTGAFSGAVSLSISGLPKGATASWSPSSTVPGSSSGATLQIQTAGNTQTDTYQLSITGTGTVSGTGASRTATLTMVVQKNQTFQIAGSLGSYLVPGKRAPLDLSLTNPYNFALQITNLTVSVDESTNKTGCSGTQNFVVRQAPAARYPISLPAGQTRTLGQLGVADGDKPQVEMVNQPWNQNACKNAAITLHYSGSAGK